MPDFRWQWAKMAAGKARSLPQGSIPGETEDDALQLVWKAEKPPGIGTGDGGDMFRILLTQRRNPAHDMRQVGRLIATGTRPGQFLFR